MMKSNNELNKRVVNKIEGSNCKSYVKEFLNDVLSFERDYLTDDFNRFSSHYKKLSEFYIKKMRAEK